MPDQKILNYTINDAIEINLSSMPFIKDGGLFIPTEEPFALNEKVTIKLKLPTQKDCLEIEGKVVWITPANALHHVISGIGIRFLGPKALAIKSSIESLLDTSIEIGGYTYGISEKNPE